MKKALIILSIAIGSFILLLLGLGKYSKKGQASGLVNGSLARCPNKPNCVCSEHKDDVDHYIEPVTIPKNSVIDDMPEVIATIKDMDGIMRNVTDNYLAATFTSSIFRYVDDFEIRIDPIHGVMHFRSAARVGHSDGGVNRKRVELFKKFYEKKISS